MALTYSGKTIGTLTLCQKKKEVIDDKLVEVKDEKGRPVYNKFKIQIRQSNCLACFLHIFKEKSPKDPAKPWRHDLVLFFVDERHMKTCLQEGGFEYWFSGKLTNIKLNIYYKEMQTLAKYMAKDGLKVQCYYKEDKK